MKRTILSILILASMTGCSVSCSSKSGPPTSGPELPREVEPGSVSWSRITSLQGPDIYCVGISTVTVPWETLTYLVNGRGGIIPYGPPCP